MSIEAHGLTVGYRGRPILVDVELRVGEGVFAALLGPNGAGKTTLLRTLAGIIRPISGYARVAGLRIPGASAAELAERVGYMPQTPRRHPCITLLEYVALSRLAPRTAIRVGEDDLEAAHEALELLGVEHLAERRVCELSGGQRQLADLAQVLAKRPRVLLLDEPVSALDPHNQHHVLEVLRCLSRERGVTILASLHDINQALDYADYAILLAEGRVVAHGAPSEVLTPENLEKVYGIKFMRIKVANRIRVIPVSRSESASCHLH